MNLSSQNPSEVKAVITLFFVDRKRSHRGFQVKQSHKHQACYLRYVAPKFSEHLAVDLILYAESTCLIDCSYSCEHFTLLPIRKKSLMLGTLGTRNKLLMTPSENPTWVWSHLLSNTSEFNRKDEDKTWVQHMTLLTVRLSFLFLKFLPQKPSNF